MEKNSQNDKHNNNLVQCNNGTEKAPQFIEIFGKVALYYGEQNYQ